MKDRNDDDARLLDPIQNQKREAPNHGSSRVPVNNGISLRVLLDQFNSDINALEELQPEAC